MGRTKRTKKTRKKTSRIIKTRKKTMTRRSKTRKIKRMKNVMLQSKRRRRRHSTKPWTLFENKGHWECQVGNKGKVCAYVCNYNVSKQTIVFCDNGEWMDSRFAHDKCL